MENVAQSECISQRRLVNIGCGRNFHSAWENLDLEPADPSIRQHDVSVGLPYEAESVDAVYHSHILEHLRPDQGKRLIEEVFRVLKPGGVMRIVVPDLERIVELYLESHSRAWNGEAGAELNYNWMKLELLDQMVREQSGGRMGQYMSATNIRNSDFVRSRIGEEYLVVQQCISGDRSDVNNWLEKIVDRWRKLREYAAKKAVGLLLGERTQEALDEALFRKQGEIHRWMYDRYSLRELCEGTGFREFLILGADESRISGFSDFALDAIDGQPRKPDSLFAECIKPR